MARVTFQDAMLICAKASVNAEGIEPLKDSLEIAHRTIIGKPSEPR